MTHSADKAFADAGDRLAAVDDNFVKEAVSPTEAPSIKPLPDRPVYTAVWMDCH